MNKAHTRMSQLLEMGLHPSNDQEFFNLVQAFPELWGQVKQEVFGQIVDPRNVPDGLRKSLKKTLDLPACAYYNPNEFWGPAQQ